jgi:glycine cleavage system aminomethyltransferase T
VTVTRIAADRFQLVTGTSFGAHDLGWLRRHMPADGSVYVDDVTAGRACFGVWGPRSRALLQSLTKSDLSHEAFPYLQAREIAVGDVPCLALRVTYVGELGYELYCPTEYGLALWDSLVATGEPHGLVLAGYRAIDSLRLEKGYRAWGSDITPETTPEAAGLGFAVRLEKAAPFLGRDALLAERAAGGPAERLRCILLDDPRGLCLGGEPVRVRGRTAGRVTSGGYGNRIGASIAYAYLPVSSSPPGTAVEVDLFGDLIAGRIVAEPPYDPQNARIRG